jgi:hypothetical protein
MTKTTTTKMTSEPVPPWKSQKIWASVIGVVLVGVLFAFGRTTEAVALAGLVGAFVLGRGLERLGAGVVLIVALELSACGAHRAQVATQASLTGLAETLHAADSALAVAVPDLSSAAIERTRARCSAGCDDPLDVYAAEMGDVDRAVDGLEVAAESLRVAQGAQDAWVASGLLPETGPLCEALGRAVGALPALLDECGVAVPPALASAGTVVELVCNAWAR